MTEPLFYLKTDLDTIEGLYALKAEVEKLISEAERRVYNYEETLTPQESETTERAERIQFLSYRVRNLAVMADRYINDGFGVSSEKVAA